MRLSGLSALPSSLKYSMPKYKTSCSARCIRLSRISSRLFDTSVLICEGLIVPSFRNFSSLAFVFSMRSEEHTSELQSRGHLVCRLLLEKKKQYINCINKPSH